MRVFFFLAASTLLAATEPHKIETYVVEARNFEQPIKLIGTLKAHHEALLTAPTSGVLTSIKVQEGARVKKGQLLATLDQDSSLRKSLSDSQVSLKNKKSRLERIKKLHKAGDVSLKDLEEAQSELAEAKKNHHRLEHELSQTEFTAPFSGECGVFRAEVGTYVQSGAPVVAIYDTRSWIAYFSVPENILTKLKIGQQVRVKNQDAKLTSFENHLNPKTHLAYAKASLQLCKSCVAGSKVPVEISFSAPNLTVPTEAVFIKNGHSYVYRVLNQKAALTRVETGTRAQKQVAILKGLSPGDVLILRGQSKIQHDDPVY